MTSDVSGNRGAIAVFEWTDGGASFKPPPSGIWFNVNGTGDGMRGAETTPVDRIGVTFDSSEGVTWVAWVRNNDHIMLTNTKDFSHFSPLIDTGLTTTRVQPPPYPMLWGIALVAASTGPSGQQTNKLHIAWQGPGGLSAGHSTDGGHTWNTARVGQGDLPSTSPAMCAWQGGLQLAWVGIGIAIAPDINVEHSLDGVGWQGATHLLVGRTDAETPAIIDGGPRGLGVAWRWDSPGGRQGNISTLFEGPAGWNENPVTIYDDQTAGGVGVTLAYASGVPNVPDASLFVGWLSPLNQHGGLTIGRIPYVEPVIQWTPDSITFPSGFVDGGVAARKLTVNNVAGSGSDLYVTPSLGPELVGHGALFGVEDQQNNSVLGTSISIPSGGNVVLNVTFDYSSGIGAHRLNLQLQTNDPTNQNVQVPLSATVRDRRN
jgi:hypothetical protein